jgi:TPR repeat protein
MAQLLLGHLYFFGLAVSTSPQYSWALFWYNKASVSGRFLSSALFSRAHMYELGLGTPVNTLHAAFLYESATELGHPNASVPLRALWKSDSTLKVRCMRARSGAAQERLISFLMGLDSRVGESSPIRELNDGSVHLDIHQVIGTISNMLAKSFLIEMPSSIDVLDFLRQPCTPEGTIEHAKKSTARELIASANQVLVFNPEAQESDVISEFFRLYKLAAHQCEDIVAAAEAQFVIGNAFDCGLIKCNANQSKKNDDKALRWYRRAAASGSGIAWYWLGTMMATGRKVERDVFKSYCALKFSHDLMAFTLYRDGETKSASLIGPECLASQIAFIDPVTAYDYESLKGIHRSNSGYFKY